MRTRLSGYAPVESEMVDQPGESAVAQDASATLGRALARESTDQFRVNLGRVGSRLIAAEPFSPVLVFGPQRSGKTTSIAVPAILEWSGPAIVTAVQQDAIEQTIEARSKVGEVMVFDPSDVLTDWPEKVGWSPLDQIDSWSEARAIARIFIQSGRPPRDRADEMWVENAIKALAPHLFAAGLNGYTMADVVRWIDTQEEFEVRSLLQGTGNEDAIRAAEAGWQQADNTKAGIYTTLELMMGIWGSPELQQSASAKSRFRLDQFFDGRANTLYVCSPPDAQQLYRPLFTAFTQLLVREIYRRNRGFAGSLLRAKGPVAALQESSPGVAPVLVVLDDAGQVAPLNDLNGLVSTATKAAVQLVSIFTDMSQLQVHYGHELGQSVVNNHSALVVLPGTRDGATSRLLDEILSDEDRSDLGVQAGRSLSSAVRQLPTGSALCLYGNLPATVVDLRSSISDPDLLELRNGPLRRSSSKS